MTFLTLAASAGTRINKTVSMTVMKIDLTFAFGALTCISYYLW
jgi:hypothetical protein